MKNKILWLAVLVCFTMIFMSGCATAPPKHLPAKYTQEDHEMSIEIVKISDKPALRDSGGGGLIGIIVSADRASDMRDIFEGIEGETVKELLRQQISDNLESAFIIDEESEDLALEVTVTNWGWFVPTTAFGIKTGSYQLEIFVTVSVYTLNPEKKQITTFRAIAQKPLGSDPKTEDTQKALMEAINELSTQVATFVLSSGA